MHPTIPCIPFRLQVLSLIAVVLTTSVGAEVRSTSLRELSFTRRSWGVDQGLPAPQVDAIAHTPDGYLWIGTHKGISRFNGEEFINFPLPNTSVFGHTRVNRLLASPSGDLWISYAVGGLAVYRDRAIHIAVPPESMGRLTALALHPKGKLLASFSINGLTTLYSVEENLECRPRFPTVDIPLDVHSLASSADGRIWAVAGEHLLYEWLEEGPIQVSLEEVSGLGSIFPLQDGRLATASARGILTYSDEQWALTIPFPHKMKMASRLVHCRQDTSGHIWLHGLRAASWHLSHERQLFRLHPSAYGLPEPIRALEPDGDGGIWVGSYNGLYHIRYSPFVNWEPPGSLTTTRVHTIGQDPSGDIWLSCAGGIASLSPGKGFPQLMSREISSERFVFASNSAGGLWQSSRFGSVFVFRDGVRERGPSIERKARTRTERTGMLVDNTGHVWMSTLQGLFRTRVNSNDPFQEVAIGGLEATEPIQEIRTDGDGRLYAVYKNHGIYRRSPQDGKWESLSEPGNPLGSQINAIAIDADDRLWAISGRRGVIGCRQADGAWHYRGVEEIGLDSVELTGILVDTHQAIWLATHSHGVARIAVPDLHAGMVDPSTSPEIVWFDQSDGLGSVAGSASPWGLFQSSDGRIWVATAKGASVLDPEHWEAHREESRSPNVRIEGLSIDGVHVSTVETQVEYHIEPGPGHVEIDFVSLNFGDAGKTRYKYRLHGLDDSWVNGGSISKAIFHRPPPGSYRFEVVAANRYGKWTESPASLRIHIAPHWWQLVYLRWAGAGILMAVAFGFYRHRIAKMSEREKQQNRFSQDLIHLQEVERKRIAQELHDGLGQNLTVALNQLALERKELTEDRAGLQLVSDVITNSVQEVRQISRNLRPDALDRIGLTRAIQGVIRATARATRLEITEAIDDIDDTLPLRDEINMYRIVQESLTNIVRHANASRATVRVIRTRQLVTAVIEDDGCGFEMEKVIASPSDEGNMGLRSIHERVRIMKGNVIWKTARRQGTRVTINIPLEPSQNRSNHSDPTPQTLTESLEH